MNRLLIILLVFIIIACSGETVSNVNTSDENSGISSLLDNANKEISKLGESASEKDGIIESITQELASKIENLDVLNNSLEAMRLQLNDISNENLSLSDENLALSSQIEKLSEEKLLLEMSVKNLRTQYEAATIEKSIESNNQKNIQKEEETKTPEIPAPITPNSKDNDKTKDFEITGLNIKIGGKNENTSYISSSVSDFNNLNPDSKVELDFVDDAFESFRDGKIDIAIDEQWFSIDDSDNSADRKKQLLENNIDYIEIPITFYAISIIVNKSNNWAECLYSDQISDIFREDFKYINWQQLHPTFPNMPISLYGVKEGNELTNKFKSKWHGIKAFRAYSPMATDLETINSVSNVPGAIGFIKFENYNETVTALDLTHWANDKSDGTTQPVFDKCLERKMETVEENYSELPFLYTNILYVNKNTANDLTYAYLDYYLKNAESYTLSAPVDLDELHTPYYSFYYDSVIEKLAKERTY
jgi:phosphate transport system substrate-binding protein|tara:strand:- start:456 stop:1883 length:1428 start_codon:yes stop_codon:yes gene_type:complete